MSSAATAKKERLRVVLVESHQQVLPHVHGRLRQRRRPQRPRAQAAGGQRRHVESWELVHFDSHADLACPVNLPARLCWRPYPDHDPNDNGDHDNSGRSTVQIMSLYEHLESTTSGIAEWILPLVLGAGCRRVTWIRPPPSSPFCSGDLQQQQSVRNASFPLGHHSFTVGAWMPAQAMNNSEAAAALSTPPSFLDLPLEARVRVDSHSPYYADDEECGKDVENITSEADVYFNGSGCFAPTHDLLFAQPVRLAVSYGDCDDVRVVEDRPAASSMPQGSTGTHRASGPSMSQPSNADCGDDNEVDVEDWILDVCLDYFWCDNPFWHDLCQMNAGFAAALSWLVCQSALYNDGLHDPSPTSSMPCQHGAHSARPSSLNVTPEHFYERRRRVLQFRQVLGEYLWAATGVAASASSASLSAAAKSPATCAPTAEHCVPAEQDAFSALSCFQGSLLSFYPDSVSTKARQAMQAVEATLAAIPDAADRAALVREGVQAIPYLTLPRDEGDPQRVIEARMGRFRESLNRSSSVSSAGPWSSNRRRLATRPLLITVARSAQDGFLPLELVDDLQESVLRVLHSQYCCCKNRRFEKVGGLHGSADPNKHPHEESNHRNRGPIRRGQDGGDMVEDSCAECSMEVVVDYDRSDGDD